MTIAKSRTIQALAAALDAAPFERWTDWLPVGGLGRRGVRAKMVGDEMSDIFEHGENGRIEWPRDSRQRPADMDGRARKLRTRNGPAWWQPPKDCKTPEAIAPVFAYVQSYFLEEWQYIGILLERRSGPCKCCGERKVTGASLWGIESNSGNDFFAEVLADLLTEATP